MICYQRALHSPGPITTTRALGEHTIGYARGSRAFAFGPRSRPIHASTVIARKNGHTHARSQLVSRLRAQHLSEPHAHANASREHARNTHTGGRVWLDPTRTRSVSCRGRRRRRCRDSCIIFEYVYKHEKATHADQGPCLPAGWLQERPAAAAAARAGEVCDRVCVRVSVCVCCC